MGRLNFDIDEAALLKAYRISSLNPTRWEDVDHEQDGSAAGSLADGPAGEETADYADPLGLKDRAIDLRDLDMTSRAAISVGSKSFDPRAFLSAVHPNATHQDLASGTAHLRKVLESRSEAIRILVEDNFDHFVAVKASTEALKTYMQDGVLGPQSDYGSRDFGEKLKQAGAKADQVFLPLLENASKAQRVRSTLGVFERSKFFFNLPGSLVESIEAGRYDVAMRDYNKGKFLLESKPSQLIMGSGGTASSNTNSQLQPQQKRIVEKVWGAVEKVMSHMRNLLVARLKEPSRSVEEQIKTIEVLLDMNLTEDPVWIYFDSQHKHILAHLRKIYDDANNTIQKAREELNSTPAQLNGDLRFSILALDSTTPDNIHSKAIGSEVWSSIATMARSLSGALLTSLPPFWKIAKDYMDGRFKKSSSSSLSRRSPSQCRTMALEIVRLYITLISEFFSLSDKAVVAPSRDSIDLPSFIPQGSNSITTAFFVSRILSDISECVGDVTTAELASDATSGLKSLLESARWRFEVVMCDLWLQDAVRLHELEAWDLDTELPATTQFLSKILQKFQIHSATSAYKIAGGIDVSKHGAIAAKQLPIGREFSQRIQKTFVDSLYALLDGLEKLSRQDYTPVASASFDVTAAPLVAQVAVDPNDRVTRMLLITSAFGRMRKQIIPSMLNQLEGALGVSIGRERDMLEEVVEQLDESLFSEYVKAKSSVVNAIIRKGISESGIDWYETPRPTEVRDYVYQALLALVRVHAQVSNVTKPLLERAMNSLVEDLTSEAFTCFQKVEKFGMGGMLRATLEIEFIHQTLVQYVSPAASKTLSAIYNSISAAYSRRPGSAGSESLQKELEGVKRTLHESRRATAIEFLCFKPTKDAPASTPVSSVASSITPTTPALSIR